MGEAVSGPWKGSVSMAPFIGSPIERLVDGRWCLALMEHSLRPGAPDGCCMAILDVKKSKLFAGPGHADLKLLSMVNAEMAYVSAYWGQL